MSISVESVETVAPLESWSIERAARDAVREIGRQDQLAREGKFHGTHILPSGPDHARLPVLLEEVGEVARELNESFGRVDSSERLRLYEELIQVAACALAWAAAIDEDRP